MTSFFSNHSFQIQFAGCSDQGLKRSSNQDSLGWLKDQHIYVIADGMGGHQGGEIASQMAVDTVLNFFKTPKRIQNPSKTPLIEAIDLANKVIFSRAQADLTLQGMGTTCLATHIMNDTLQIAHVGDSRLYYFYQGETWQLTRDHSLVEEKIQAGLLSREQAEKDSMRNVITRAVGFESKVLTDLYTFKIRPGDLFLLCSDGLSSYCKLSEIKSLMTHPQLSLSQKSRELCDLANRKGGHDNTTVLLIEVES